MFAFLKASFVGFLFCFLFCVNLYGFDKDMSETWLLNAVNTSKDIDSQSDIALATQLIKEATMNINLEGDLAQIDTANIINALDLIDKNCTESLSNTIIVYKTLDKNISYLIDILSSFQNSDGGFGHKKDFESTPLDTALALDALDVSLNKSSVTSAINYLLAQQKDDGSWNNIEGSSLYTTALAMRSLWKYRKAYDVGSSVEKAKEYLSLASTEEIFLQAIILRSIAPLCYTKDELLLKIMALKNSQLADGSWDDDVYMTALALQALFLADRDIPNPDLATLSGVIVDGDSNVALSGITVELEGIATITTGESGEFAFDGLQNDTYTLNILSNNYAPLYTSIHMVGDDINLGTLRLNKNIDATISTIRGTITDIQNDTPLDSVTVSIGDKQTTTDEGGNYIIDSIEAGTYTITLQKAGYIQANQSITVLANTIVQYNASLRSLDLSTSARIFGTIVDNETLGLLENAQVSLTFEDSMLTQNTTSKGIFEFKNLSQGDYKLEITKDEYHSVYTNFTIQSTQNIDYGIIKLTKADQNQSSSVAIQGIVTDTYTKQPISGATISVSGATTLTSADGSYLLENIPSGEISIEASMDGYYSTTGTASVTSGSTLIFSPSLKPTDETKLKIFGTLLDAETFEPLSDVNVTLSGENNATVYTNIEGYYIFDELAQGKTTIKINKFGYQAIIATINVSDTNVEFSPSMQKDTNINGETNISGVVLDVADNTPLVNVAFFINEIDTGIRSDVNGSFNINDIVAQDISLTLRKSGYKDVNTVLILPEAQDVDIGNLYMRLKVDDLKPNLTVEAINASNITTNPNTLSVAGDLNVTVFNRGTTPAKSFDIIAFYDTNADGNFTESEDRVFAIQKVESSLGVDESQAVIIDVATTADFREQPIYIYVDSKNENVELDENNLYSTAKSCGGKQGRIDLGICFDYSGSVGSLANMQKNGLIQALRDPAKFPRDGSMRLTLMTATNRTYLQPTVITEANAVTIADQIQNTYFSGGSHVDDCLRYMANKLAEQVDQSTYKAITLSGDGQWGSGIVSDREYAVSKGVNVIDAIGIGSLSWSTLNGIVYPQPSGGDYGVVRVAKTAEEVSNSLMSSFKKQTKIADLTIGKLEIVDNGADQNISIRFITGNAGIAEIPETVNISIFEGDPSEDGVLLKTISLDQNLSFGMSMEIQVDGIMLQEGGSIYIVGDYENNLVECTKENNTISTIISPTTTLGTITPKTEKESYSANEAVLLSATIANPGRLSYKLSAGLTIEDSGGNIVADFVHSDLGIIASGENREITQAWNSGSIITGTYTLKGTLYDAEGNTVDESSVEFRITTEEIGGNSASLDINTDKLRYYTSDIIDISGIVENISSNSIIADATVILEIFDSSNSLIETKTLTFDDLLPKSTRELKSVYEYTRLMMGGYTINGRLLDGSDAVLATDSASFEVFENLTQAIKGSVKTAWAKEIAGAQQTCSFSVTNFGSSNLTDIELKLDILDINQSTIKESFPALADINSSQSISGAQTFSTKGYDAGGYGCGLYAKIDDNWILLDHQLFKIDLPPINIESTLSRGSKGRMLILLDPCEKNKCSICCKPTKYTCEEPYDPKDAPSLEEQRAYLENLLHSNNYGYIIVTDKKTFEKELRSGMYDLYLIMSETISLDINTQKELREAVFKGENLLIAGVHDNRNSYLFRVAGIDMKGHYPKVQGVDIVDNGYGNFHLSLLQKSYPIKFKPYDDASVIANYDLGSNQCVSSASSAIATHDYGKGKSIFVGFDILAQAATQADTLHENLLIQMIDELLIKTSEGFNAEDIIPIDLTVVNKGMATPIQTEISVSSNAFFVDVIGADEQDLQTLIFNEDLLDEDETKTYKFWTQALTSEDQVEITAHIFSLLDGDRQEQAQDSLVISIKNTKDIDEVIYDAYQIVLQKSLDRAKLNFAILELTFAKKMVDKNSNELALLKLLLVISQLDSIQEKEAVESLRVSIDRYIRKIEIEINRGED